MKRSHLLVWALLAALSCWHRDAATRPITGDNRLYFFMAERAASGVAPHVSLVDPKNQLGTLLTAASIHVSRTLGGDDVVASRLVSVAFAAVSVALAARLASLLASSALAGHVAALALLATRGLAHHAALGSNPKVFLMAFVLLAHVAMASGDAAPTTASRSAGRGGGETDASRLRATAALAAVAAACAFLCWQPALLVLAAVAMEVLVRPGGGPLAALRIVGVAALAVAAYQGWFAMHGALAAQVHQAYVMTLGSLHEPARLAQALRFLWIEAGGSEAWPRVGPSAFLCLAVWSLVRIVRAPLASVQLLRTTPGAASFALGAAGATAFTIYDHQGLPDLFFPAPYFAVSAGLVAAFLARGIRGLAGRGAALAAVATVIALVAVQAWNVDVRRPRPVYSLDDQRAAAAEVRLWREGGESVWAWEAVHLLALARLDNHVPVALFFDDLAAEVDPATWRPLREGQMPDRILRTVSASPGPPAWLAQEYRLRTPPAFLDQDLEVWGRTVPAAREAPP